MDSIATLLPGLVALSLLFGTTSMLAVTVTFEKKNASFDRLLLSPIPLELLMLAKTSGAVLFGIFNALVPIVMASFIIDLSGINWFLILPAVILIAAASTFLGLFIAVSVSEVFEAQTFSNFFRFPMIFLCGLFFPVAMLPLYLRPLSYALPLTYGVDILHNAFQMTGMLPLWLDFLVLSAFCVLLFAISLRNVYRKWIV
jgi:ABC-2 type transport system permease protein